MFPKHIPFPDVTVLYSTFQTGHVALHHRGRLAAGEWLLVLGAAGGVGSAALQLGLAAGARVIATAGSAEKLEFCRRLGAHHVVDYHDENFSARLTEITEGHGLDVVFDPVGGQVTEIVRRHLAWQGRHLVIGFAAGDIPSFPANHVLMKNYEVIGVHWSEYTLQEKAVVEASHAALLDLYESATIRPAICQKLPLADIVQALSKLERRDVAGRLVVVQ